MASMDRHAENGAGGADNDNAVLPASGSRLVGLVALEDSIKDAKADGDGDYDDDGNHHQDHSKAAAAAADDDEDEDGMRAKSAADAELKAELLGTETGQMQRQINTHTPPPGPGPGEDTTPLVAPAVHAAAAGDNVDNDANFRENAANDSTQPQQTSPAPTPQPLPWADADDYEQAVGWKVRVWWPRMSKWYPGKVASFDAETQMHTVRYNDGDVSEVSICVDTIHWISGPNAPSARKSTGGGARRSSGAAAAAPLEVETHAGATMNWVQAAKLRENGAYVQLPTAFASPVSAPAPQPRKRKSPAGAAAGTGLNWVAAARLRAQGIDPSTLVMEHESAEAALKRAQEEVKRAEAASAAIEAQQRQLRVEEFLEADRRQRQAELEQELAAKAARKAKAAAAREAKASAASAAAAAAAATTAAKMAKSAKAKSGKDDVAKMAADAARHMGWSVEVYWDGDDTWYAGKVLDYSLKTNTFDVLYDDGMRVKDEKLVSGSYRWLAPPGKGDGEPSAKRSKLASKGASKQSVPASSGAPVVAPPLLAAPLAPASLGGGVVSDKLTKSAKKPESKKPPRQPKPVVPEVAKVTSSGRAVKRKVYD